MIADLPPHPCVSASERLTERGAPWRPSEGWSERARIPWNATPSITLHSAPKLAQPLSIREYSGHYSEAYAWK